MSKNPFIILNNELKELIKETTDIDNLLLLWNEVNIELEQAKSHKEILEDKIKNYLKDRKWDDYMDNTNKIHVKLELIRDTHLDKEQLKDMLTESQLAQITRTTTRHSVSVITQKNRERMKQIVQKKNS